MANIPEKIKDAGTIGTALLMYMPDDKESLPSEELSSRNIQALRATARDKFVEWAKTNNKPIYTFWSEQIDPFMAVAGEQTIEKSKLVEAYAGGGLKAEEAEVQADIVMANLAIAARLVEAYDAYNHGFEQENEDGDQLGDAGGQAALVELFKNSPTAAMPDKMKTAGSLGSVLAQLQKDGEEKTPALGAAEADTSLLMDPARDEVVEWLKANNETVYTFWVEQIDPFIDPKDPTKGAFPSAQKITRQEMVAAYGGDSAQANYALQNLALANEIIKHWKAWKADPTAATEPSVVEEPVEEPTEEPVEEPAETKAPVETKEPAETKQPAETNEPPSSGISQDNLVLGVLATLGVGGLIGAFIYRAFRGDPKLRTQLSDIKTKFKAASQRASDAEKLVEDLKTTNERLETAKGELDKAHVKLQEALNTESGAKAEAVAEVEKKQGEIDLLKAQVTSLEGRLKATDPQRSKETVVVDSEDAAKLAEEAAAQAADAAPAAALATPAEVTPEAVEEAMDHADQVKAQLAAAAAEASAPAAAPAALPTPAPVVSEEAAAADAEDAATRAPEAEEAAAPKKARTGGLTVYRLQSLDEAKRNQIQLLLEQEDINPALLNADQKQMLLEYRVEVELDLRYENWDTSVEHIRSGIVGQVVTEWKMMPNTLPMKSDVADAERAISRKGFEMIVNRQEKHNETLKGLQKRSEEDREVRSKTLIHGQGK